MLHYSDLTEEQLHARFVRGRPTRQKNHPYPGLANLGSTCYVNGVCQVLLHCDASRNWLRHGIEASSVAEENPRKFLNELQNLGEILADGCPAVLGEHRSRFDVWSPHAFIEALQRCRPLALNEQHDAGEALEEMLTRTGMGEELFNTGCQRSARPDVVTLPQFSKDGWWYQHFTSERQVINMRGLLSAQ